MIRVTSAPPRRRSPAGNRLAAVRPALLGALLAGCTGPQLHLVAAGPDRVFVDGVETGATSLPFRYYGTTRWDALPADVDGFADFARQPGSATVPLPAPASGWLFPLDFPLELLSRAVYGRGDTTVHLELSPTPPEQLAVPEILPEAVGELSARARAARSER